MEPWKIKREIQLAILKGKTEIAIMLFPPKRKHEGIEIFVSLSNIRYSGIETDTKKGIVKLLNREKEPFLLFSEAISSIRCP